MAENLGKISVIIPIYNVGKYLFACLESVVKQSYSNLEILCVDDCSSDNSIQIAESFAAKDSRIKIIKHTENKGAGVARNTALDIAAGEYIFFLDPDDTIVLDILEKLYNNAKTTNADIIVSQTKTVAEDNSKETLKRLRKVSEYLEFLQFEEYQVCEDNFEEALFKLPYVVWGRLFSKNFIDKNKLRFIEEKYMFEDNGFCIKMISAFPKISSINDIGIYYLIRANSVMADSKKFKSKKRTSLKAVLEDAINYISATKEKNIAEKLINIIKKNNPKCFYKGLKILTVSKREDSLEIKLLGVRLYRSYKLSDYKIYKILGIKFKKAFK